jgi:hypothetical protein
VKAHDPCPPGDRQVCETTRDLARALLRRMAEKAAGIEPRIRTLVATQGERPGDYLLWRLYGVDGRLLFQFDLLQRPDPIWSGVGADLSLIARLADLRTHPPGYYYVHPLPDRRDVAVPLPANPRGLAPRTIGSLRPVPSRSSLWPTMQYPPSPDDCRDNATVLVADIVQT